MVGGAPSAMPGGGEDTVLASTPGGRSYADRHAAVEGLQPAYWQSAQVVGAAPSVGVVQAGGHRQAARQAALVPAGRRR